LIKNDDKRENSIICKKGVNFTKSGINRILEKCGRDILLRKV